MTVSFKSFRADMKKIFHNVAESDGFRITGDCSIHHSDMKSATGREA